MSVETLVALGSLVFAVFTSIVAIAMLWGRLNEKVDGHGRRMEEMEALIEKSVADLARSQCEDRAAVEKRIEGDKSHNDSRIAELYESRNAMEKNMSVISTSMQYMAENMREIKDSINGLVLRLESK